MENDRLGPYRLKSPLGSGGFGTVYLAEVCEDSPGLRAGDEVALKVIHPHLLSKPGYFKRFMSEAEAGLRVRHENVVSTLDVDCIESGGEMTHFMVMEYVEGETLQDILERDGPFPEKKCIAVARGVAAGLGAIHDAGIVHRDIKPSNLLLTMDGKIKVMDLGIAYLRDRVNRMSRTGEFIGTILYAAPEQLSPKLGGVDERTDLYALGLTLHHLATGKHPMDGADLNGILSRLLLEEPGRLRVACPSASPYFEAVVGKLLRRHRQHRFSSAAELSSVLAEGERSPWWLRKAGGESQVTEPGWSDAGRMLTWPFRSPSTLTFLGGVTLLCVTLAVAWAVGRIPVIGLPVRLAAELAVAAWWLAFVSRVARNSVEIVPRIPPWPSPADWPEFALEGLGPLSLSVVLALPAVAAAAFRLPPYAIAALAVAGSVPLPAVLLFAAFRRRCWNVSPPRVLEFVLGAGSLLTVASGTLAVMIAARFLVSDASILTPVVETLMFLAILVATHIAGRIAAGSDRLLDLLAGTPRPASAVGPASPEEGEEDEDTIVAE